MEKKGLLWESETHVGKGSLPSWEAFPRCFNVEHCTEFFRHGYTSTRGCQNRTISLGSTDNSNNPILLVQSIFRVDKHRNAAISQASQAAATDI